MNAVSPSEALKKVAEATPEECHDQILIIGSLAAGYHFFRDDPAMQVRTKDVDCVIYPRIKAIPSGQKVANALLEKQWQPETEGYFSEPGNAQTLDDKLPAVRLYPPDSHDWFVELLTVPASEEEYGRQFTRIIVPSPDAPDTEWHFGLPSFRFLTLTQWQPLKSEYGIYYARPSMMALANLLEHPAIGDELMTKEINGKSIKRSNKDLGRVLALAYLTGPDDLEAWAEEWSYALEEYFPNYKASLTDSLVNGLHALTSNPEDLDEALHTCNSGLLNSSPVTIKQLQIIAERLKQDVIETVK